MLALFFDGNPHATVFFQNSVSSSNVVKIVSLIERKLTAFEDFDRRFPAFGGYLPWFAHDGSGAIVPAHDWQNTVPSLDNGEMIYGIVALREALAKSQYAQLARVKQIIQVLFLLFPIFIGQSILSLLAEIRRSIGIDGQNCRGGVLRRSGSRSLRHGDSQCQRSLLRSEQLQNRSTVLFGRSIRRRTVCALSLHADLASRM